MSKEAIDRLLESYGETGAAVTEKDTVYKKVVEWAGKTDLKFGNIRKVQDREGFHYVVHLHGGNNGKSDWPSYLAEISAFIIFASKKFHVWVIKLINDCPDDVFDVYIGLEEDIK